MILTAPVPNSRSTRMRSPTIGIVRVGQRQTDLFADQMAITLVFRMDGHRGIAEHGFGPCRGDSQTELRDRRRADNGW